MKRIVFCLIIAVVVVSCVSAQGADMRYYKALGTEGASLVNARGELFSLPRDYAFFLSGFENGYARVAVKTSKRKIVDILVDEQGRFLFDPDCGYTDIRYLNENRFLVAKGDMEKGQDWGIIDRAMNVIVEPKYRLFNVQYDDKVAIFGEIKNNVWYYGIMDFDGKILLTPQCIYMLISVGQGVVSYLIGSVNTTTRYGYLDITGKPLIPAKYDLGYPFSYGFAVVREPGGVYRVINTKGEIQMQFPPGVCRPFRDGLALVFQGGKTGYVNTEGVMVVPPKYTHGTDFQYGYAVVGNIEGHFNMNAMIITDTISTLPWPAEYHVIDRMGRVVVSGMFLNSPFIREGGVLECAESTADGGYREYYLDLTTMKKF